MAETITKQAGGVSHPALTHYESFVMLMAARLSIF